MKKNKIIIIISIFIGALLIFGSIIIIHNYNKSKSLTVSEVYGVVKQVNNDSIIVEDPNTKSEKTYILDTTNYHEGDLIVIRSKGDKVEESKVIVEGYSNYTTNPVIVIDNPTTTTTTTTTGTVTTTREITSSNQNTIVKTTTIANVNKTTTTKSNNTQAVTNKDDLVLTYLKNEEASVKTGDNSETFKEKAKRTFITVVDFIFYGGEIKGVTFKELSDSAKAKVLYYALLIDNGIDSKFPNYKEKIGDKYKAIKAKLVAEFLELKYDICNKSPDGCKQASEDLELLKKSLNITWDFVKSVFVYVKDLTIPKIKAWYESFRG